MTDRREEVLLERLEDAFAAELVAAERELARRPLLPPEDRPRSRVAIAATAVMVLVAASVLFVSTAPHDQGTTSTPIPATAGLSTPAAVSPSPVLGSPSVGLISPSAIPGSPAPVVASIPSSVLGYQVLTVSEAHARIDAGDQRTELIVGGRSERFVADCAAPPCQEVWTLDDPAAAQLAIILRFSSAVAAPAPGLVIVRFGGPSCRAPCGPPFDVLQVLWDAAPLDARLPGDVGGEPVLTASQAIAVAETDATAPFLVGGWYRPLQANCAAPPPGTPPPASRLTPCGYEEVAQHPFTQSVPSFPGAGVIFLDGKPTRPANGPAVLRVHAHDPLAAQCAAADRARCERTLVVEDVVWSSEAYSPSTIQIPKSVLGFPVITVSEARTRIAAGDQAAIMNVGGWLLRGAADCAAPPCPGLWTLYERTLDGPKLAVRFAPSENSTPPEPTSTGPSPVVLALGGPGCAQPCVPPLRVESVLWDAMSLDPELPRKIAGEPVLSPSQAIAIADTDDAAPFLVGGWYRVVVNACAPPPPGTPPPTSPLTPYCPAVEVLAEVPLSATTAMFPGAPVTFLEAERPVPNRPAVLRVHAHDSRAALCATFDRARCERMLVVEAVVWTAQSPAPSPSPTEPAPSPSASPSGSPPSMPTTLLGFGVLSVPEARALLQAGDASRAMIVGGRLGPASPDCALPCTSDPWVLTDPSDAGSRLMVRLTTAVAPPARDMLAIVQLGGPSCATRCIEPLDVGVLLWDSAPLAEDLPQAIGGEPVLSASQALATAETADARQFLVGGWFRGLVLPCPAPPPGAGPTPPLIFHCGPHDEVGERQFTEPGSAKSPSAQVWFPAEAPMRPAYGRAVLRVHSHDAQAVDCVAEARPICERQLVVDAVVWTPSTAASPSGSPQASPSPAPSGSVGLPVGVPHEFFAGPVINVAEAQVRLQAATDDTRLLVGGWLESPPIPCPKPLIRAGPCNRFLVAQGGDISKVGEALHLRFVDDLPSYLGDGAAVVRVHQNDPRVSPDDIVVDEIMWLLPSTALPHPTADAYQWDGLPVALGGEQVLRPTAALALARQKRGAEPFLVGGWFGRTDLFRDVSDCLHPPRDHPLFIDKCLHPGFRAGWPVREISDGQEVSESSDWEVVGVPGGTIPDGRVVLRVHVHDPAAASCPVPFRAQCWDALVVDEILWHESAPLTNVGRPANEPRALMVAFLEARAQGDYRRATELVSTYVASGGRYAYERFALAAMRFERAGAATDYVLTQADPSNLSGAHLGAAYAHLVAQGLDLSTAHLYVIKHPGIADRSLDPEEWVAATDAAGSWTLYPVTWPDLPELQAVPPPA